MLTKFVLAFSILALAIAVAGSIPAKGPTSHVILTEPVVLHGAALKAGEYRVVVGTDKVTFLMDKESNEIPAKVEVGDKKFSQNAVQYEHKGTQATISEICLGGTKTRVVFE